MAERNPVVSVIIPTYLEEETIGGCLKSIAHQDFDGEIETIVVDSHSPDRTREVAAACADRVVDLNARGVGKARNAGAKLATGEILLFVDADTYLESHFVAELYRAFRDPKVVCVSGILRGLEQLGTLDNLFAISHYGFLNKLAAFQRMWVFRCSRRCASARESLFSFRRAVSSRTWRLPRT